MLQKFTISDWPNMKKNNRESLHRKLHKIGYPDTYSRTVTLDQLKTLMKDGKL